MSTRYTDRVLWERCGRTWKAHIEITTTIGIEVEPKTRDNVKTKQFDAVEKLLLDAAKTIDESNDRIILELREKLAKEST